MERAVEQDAVRDQARRDVGEAELVVAFVLLAIRVRELVLVKVHELRCRGGGRAQRDEVGEAEEVARKDRVVFADAVAQHLGHVDGRAPHAPFPFARGQGHEVDLVAAGALPALEKGLVRPAEKGLDSGDAHTRILTPL